MKIKKPWRYFHFMPLDRIEWMEKHCERGSFSDAIRQKREERGLTQFQLAEILEITPAMISIWESGLATPKGRTLGRLSAALECSMDELIGICKPDVAKLCAEIKILRALIAFYEMRFLKIHKLNPLSRQNHFSMSRSLTHYAKNKIDGPTTG